MKWKKTGAALLVTTLTVTSAGYAFANNQLFDTVDLSKLNQQPAETTVVTTVSEKPVTPSKTEVEEKPTNQTTNLQENGLPKIPADYPYDNLKGLYKAYENAQNPKAKESIKLKIEYLIAKYETVKKYKSDDLKEYAKDMEELKKESLKKQQEVKKEVIKKQQEVKKEALKEQKEKEKKLRKAQQELRKELKGKEKELHKAEKYKNKHNHKNKHEDNDED